jgi:hypothetical protein
MLARYRLFPIIIGTLLILVIAGCAPVATGTTAGAPQAAARSASALATGQEPTPRTVTVSGLGTANAAPDVAYVQLGVQIIETDASLAVEESTTRMAAVMDVIKAMGVAEKDVQTTQYAMSVQQQYDREGKPTGEITYRVSNQVRVKLHDLSKIGELLQKTLAARANTVGGVTFSIEDPDALQQQARDEAIADARTKAEQLAAGLGASLGPVRQVSEFGGGRPVAEVAKTMELRAAGGGEVPISGGELSVSVQIQVVFDLVE